MTRKSILAMTGLTVVAAVGAIVTVILTGDAPEDPNVKRGKEFLSVEEYSAATSEFKIALKKHPDNQVAKALLLYTHERSEGEAASVIFRLYPILESMTDREATEPLPDQRRRELEELVKKLRAALYEEGIDTRDRAEVIAIIRTAAEYVFEETTNPAEADEAALVLAWDGDDEALAHLCDRLKSEKAEHVPELLALLGAQAVPALQRVVADRNHLGRVRALDVLARTLAADLAREFFASNPNLRGLAFSDLPGELQLDEARSLLATRHVAGLSRAGLASPMLAGSASADGQELISLYARLSDERGVLVLEGHDPENQRVLMRAFVFDSGRYEPARLLREGKVVPLAKPLVRLRALDEGRLEMTFLAVASVAEERRVRRRSFSPGDRVALKGSKGVGTVRGTDEYGLIQVGLDEEVQGMRTVELAASMLMGLETVTVKKPGYEIQEARVKGTTIELGPVATTESLHVPFE